MRGLLIEFLEEAYAGNSLPKDLLPQLKQLFLDYSIFVKITEVDAESS
tara:strand:+ start:345 stop:488 length:144 start_codon:yes stop_codon:yes gene_type:complete